MSAYGPASQTFRQYRRHVNRISSAIWRMRIGTQTEPEHNRTGLQESVFLLPFVNSTIKNVFSSLCLPRSADPFESLRIPSDSFGFTALFSDEQLILAILFFFLFPLEDKVNEFPGVCSRYTPWFFSAVRNYSCPSSAARSKRVARRKTRYHLTYWTACWWYRRHSSKSI